MDRSEIKDGVERGFNPPDIYQDQEYLQRMDVAKENAFCGDYPVEDIFEELTNQFSNYIQLDASDRTNYVEIFFKQLKESMDEIIEEDGDLLENQLEYLDIVYNYFVDLISTLFQRRLCISLNFLETNPYDSNAYDMLSILYKFFILDARKNFKNYFTERALLTMKKSNADQTNLVATAYNILDDMDHTLIMDGMVEDFIRKATDKSTADTIYGYFEENIISGNFLIRYSPRFYQNTDLLADIADDVITMYQYHKEKE